jgi:glucokinase
MAGDASGAIHERRRFSVDRTLGAQGIRDQIQQALPALIQDREIRGIGVGFGGPVNWKTGAIARSHQIEGWSGFELGAWLRRLTSLPVRVENDANVAAFGEARAGAGRGCDPVFYITLGSGVGGGLVVGGKIYHGAVPGEAEIGHIRLDRTGATVESRCSGWAVDARVRAIAAKDPGGRLAALVRSGSGSEARHLLPALDQGDPGAQRILREAADDLALGLSHVTHLFHPEIIILGGGLSSLGEPLRSAVESALAGCVMEVFAPGPRVALAGLGEDAVPAGALILAGEMP